MSERRTALVTGGARRVGRAIVERLAEAGFDVAFTYRGSQQEAHDLAEMLAQRGHRVVTRQIDLADTGNIPQLASWARASLGQLDVLVNNASLYLPDDGLAGASPELMTKLMNVNFVAPAWLTTNLLPELKASRGIVVNMVDLLATRPWPQYSAYCASKAAIQNFTLSMARKLAPEARCVGIAPGVVDWPEDMSESARNTYLSKVPLGRGGTPQDVANLVHFLATEGAYITGEIIRLDGGRGIV